MLTASPSDSPSRAPLERGGPDKDSPTGKEFTPKQWVLGLTFGIVFGFLLQKGGVAKYDILMGALLLDDFTVVKVMLSAILVGSIGIFTMYGLGLVKLHIKATRYAANIVGGLLFGVGFALLGYCPGTGAAAIGQGNWDAIVGVIGLLLGSLVFAEMSATLDKTLMKTGDRGKLMLHDIVGLQLTPFLVVFIAMLAACLVTLEMSAL